MFDLPLHPIVVHFPIVLAVLIPLMAIFLLVGIKKGFFSQKTWGLVVVLSALYLISSVVAVEMGEEDEDVVENVVSHDVLEEHEEAGELIPWIAGGILLISLTPLALKYRTRLQLLTVIVSSLGLAPVIEAGHTGGLLIYQHGAASAHQKKSKEGIENSKAYDGNEDLYDDTDDDPNESHQHEDDEEED